MVTEQLLVLFVPYHEACSTPALSASPPEGLLQVKAAVCSSEAHGEADPTSINANPEAGSGNDDERAVLALGEHFNVSPPGFVCHVSVVEKNVRLDVFEPRTL